MTPDDQTTHLANEIDNLIDRFRTEYDMTYATAVGVLQMKIWFLCSEASERGTEVEEM